MSILTKLSALQSVTSSTQVARVEMTAQNVEDCKAAIRRDNRGYNVQPNRFDIATPYRVAINFGNVWHNYGDFTSADVAAAVGTIVSAAFFGDKAKQGNFNSDKVEADANFAAWLADPRNVEVIAKAGDVEACYFKTGTLPTKGAVQPF